MIDVQNLTAALATEFEVSFDDLVLDPGGAEFADWEVLSACVAQLQKAQGYRIVGISGSQGSGKSTLAHCLIEHMGSLRGDALSLDDFYLSKRARQELAATVHPLLKTRGVPGTHDWQWLQDILTDATRDAGSLQVPIFNKGLDDRVGTRALQADCLVFEGWCLGVHPQAEEALITPVNELEQREDPQAIWRCWVNDQTAHYQACWQTVDFWLHLRVPSFTQVFEWRLQQEQGLPIGQRMSAEQIDRFIAHYERLTRALWQQSPQGPGLLVNIGKDHRVSSIEVVKM